VGLYDKRLTSVKITKKKTNIPAISLRILSCFNKIFTILNY